MQWLLTQESALFLSDCFMAEPSRQNMKSPARHRNHANNNGMSSTQHRSRVFLEYFKIIHSTQSVFWNLKRWQLDWGGYSAAIELCSGAEALTGSCLKCSMGRAERWFPGTRMNSRECSIHRENGGTLGMVPLIINPIQYTLHSGYFPMIHCQLPRFLSLRNASHSCAFRST